jgi:hypothetical protein
MNKSERMKMMDALFHVNSIGYGLLCLGNGANSSDSDSMSLRVWATHSTQELLTKAGILGSH